MDIPAKAIKNVMFNNIDELGKSIYNKLINKEINWNDVDEIYFLDMQNQKDVNYNNLLIQSINKNIPANQMKFSEFSGLIF